MLIACGLIVSALESRTRVEFNRESLDLLNDNVKVDIGDAARYLPQSVYVLNIRHACVLPTSECVWFA